MGTIVSPAKRISTRNVFLTRKPKKGKIVINGTAYILTSLSIDRGGSYKLSGEQVVINTSKCRYRDEGGDCVYGTFSTVTIMLNGVSKTIGNVELQDCPDIDQE